MKKILFFTFAICLLTFTSSFADIPREYFHKQYEAFGVTPSRADSVHSFDALSYEINLQLFPSNHYILGNVLARIMAKEDNLTEISYELEQLNVDSVLVNGTSASFFYDDEVITITLDQPYNIGDTLSTQVFYQGYPTLSSDVYHTGIYWQNYIFTYSDPNGTRFWWPCYDHPWDKATTKMNIKVPDNMLVASNGILVDEIDNGDGTKTFCWDNTDQIATYLVSFCAGDYATFEQDYGDLPIINYVYPSHLNFAQSDFACIPTAMGIYENLYGNYPFQKYGMAECGIFGGWGGMEHQTMTSIGNGLINGMGTYELIFVHELAHQWFGDCLTPLTWKDVWLSEGFATYSEALYVEATEGFDAMCDYVESSFHQYYLNWAGGNAYTVYDPPYNAYFTPATYEKPASVLHMLRLMVEDSTFFDILQSYFDTYKYGNVITTDFIDVCESVSGMDLQEFFNDWIFGSGVPRFEYYYLKAAIGNGTTPAVIIRTRSLSDTDTHFEMQVPFSVNINGEIDSVLADAGAEEFESTTCSWLSEWPVYVSLQFDPHHWILDRGSTEIRPILDAAYPADGQVVLYWEEFPDTTLFPYWTYKVYRKSEAQPQYEEIYPVYLDEYSCVDTTVVNGITYDYVIT
ncbi:MAG: M1 family aminopeptidase, partial [Candidatus Cloacimonadia bacterium]